MPGAASIPSDWWKEACQAVNHPLACVGVDSTFMWVNESWCRLTGYAPAELYQLTWQSITELGDIGGDLAAVKEVMEGTRDSYYLEKKYIRKDGTRLPVAIVVHRFPVSSAEPIICFIAEAMDRTRDNAIQKLETELEILKQSVMQIQEKVTRLSTLDFMFDTLIPYVKTNWKTISFFLTGLTSLVVFLYWLIENIMHVSGK